MYVCNMPIYTAAYATSHFKVADNNITAYKRVKSCFKKVLAKLRKNIRVYSRYLETRDGRDYLQYKKERNLAKLELRKAVEEYEAKIAKRAKRNPKAFYKYVDCKLKTRTGIPDLKTEDGSAVNDEVKADMFNKFFSSLFY